MLGFYVPFKTRQVRVLLPQHHHTRFRFSINTPEVIKKYDHGTPGIGKRLAAAGYPLGFIIAPIMVYPGWDGHYRKLLEDLRDALGPAAERDITFGLISHRFTARAKKRILEVFPSTTLPMEEEARKFKYGQFGYGKYVYPGETMEGIGRLYKSG